ncbi:MAG: DUF192 domain-containing protein [Gammaproteobacteria bacterium]|jgi:uncharacterized membrane protein (UPF0127 family)|nr:DUF192 domain-containing protein [Gammaproteobacteria bacterium]MDH3846673.1 DUF192 domain-containing protein [Gammaproteobacteria bacterium]MDH3864356.1 DUF192 domain-containing protein [Gammaproteobacteria bacterium]MDH3906052.1 DUF192 domain-containing protein [Gammaproteobacteria bacterium]MDH4004755.1 DUF192 domain-containing protein [Gammaproteobacteria bacterium]
MRSVRAILLMLCLMPLSATAQEPLEQSFESDVLVIVARDACYRFDIYLALSGQQQRRGLMFVRKMPAWTGMLFVYPDENYRSMWMKNTYIPLDMVFARRDGSIANIASDTVPLSEQSITSSKPVSFVLELNAGTARRLSIDADSHLIWEPAMQ